MLGQQPTHTLTGVQVPFNSSTMAPVKTLLSLAVFAVAGSLASAEVANAPSPTVYIHEERAAAPMPTLASAPEHEQARAARDVDLVGDITSAFGVVTSGAASVFSVATSGAASLGTAVATGAVSEFSKVFTCVCL